MKYKSYFFVTFFLIGIVGIVYTSEAATIIRPPRSVIIKQQGEFFDISWKKPLSSNYSGFRVYRSKVKGEIGDIKIKLRKNILYFEDTDILPNNAYFYTVRAIGNRGKESKNTAQVTAIRKVPVVSINQIPNVAILDIPERS